jgi:hypothetical protein
VDNQAWSPSKPEAHNAATFDGDKPYSYGNPYASPSECESPATALDDKGLLQHEIQRRLLRNKAGGSACSSPSSPTPSAGMMSPPALPRSPAHPAHPPQPMLPLHLGGLAMGASLVSLGFVPPVPPSESPARLALRARAATLRSMATQRASFLGVLRRRQQSDALQRITMDKIAACALGGQGGGSGSGALLSPGAKDFRPGPPPAVPLTPGAAAAKRREQQLARPPSGLFFITDGTQEVEFLHGVHLSTDSGSWSQV